MITQPDCSTLKQNPSPFKKPGDDIRSKRSNGHGMAAMLFPPNHAASSAFEKCIFSTCPNFTKLYLRQMVINSYVLYL